MFKLDSAMLITVLWFYRPRVTVHVTVRRFMQGGADEAFRLHRS